MSRAEDVVRRSMDLYHRGESAEAEDVVRDGLRRFPDDGDLWQLDGLMRHGRGDFCGARESLMTAGLLVPLDPSAQWRWRSATCGPARRSWPAACIGTSPRIAAARRRCCRRSPPAWGASGRTAWPWTSARSCRRREPERHEALVGMAFYMRRLGRPAEAIIPVAARAHELAPQIAPYRVLLASLLSGTGRHREAAELLRGLAPDSIQCRGCLRRMTTIFHLAGDLAMAEAFRRRARRIGDSPRATSSGEDRGP